MSGDIYLAIDKEVSAMFGAWEAVEVAPHPASTIATAVVVATTTRRERRPLGMGTTIGGLRRRAGCCWDRLSNEVDSAEANVVLGYA